MEIYPKSVVTFYLMYTIINFLLSSRKKCFKLSSFTIHNRSVGTSEKCFFLFNFAKGISFVFVSHSSKQFNFSTFPLGFFIRDLLNICVMSVKKYIWLFLGSTIMFSKLKMYKIHSLGTFLENTHTIINNKSKSFFITFHQ